MEFRIPLLQIIISFLLVLFMAAIRSVRKSKARNLTQKFIPGPRKLPLIGNLHQLAGPGLLHRTLRDLATKHGPIMHLQLGQVSTVVVSSAEMAKEIMKTHDIVFANRPFLVVSMITTYECTDIAFSPYGNYWRHLRKICTEELLSAARVNSFQSIREEEVLNLIETIKSNEVLAVNLSEKVFSMIYGITARAAFGKKCKNQDAFVSVISEESKVNSGFLVSEFFPSLKFLDVVSGLKHRVEKIHGEADRILGNIVNDHKESIAKGIREDLVDVLLRLQENGEVPLTDNNIKAIIFDIFSGGSETSASVVEWAMSEMIKNPRVMTKAQAEVRQVFQGKGNVDEIGIHQLKYLKCVIKETLRLHPVFPLLLPRECSQNCEVNGFEIPSKTRVIINAWAIGRDPNHWVEPEKFEPERFINSSVDFVGTNFEFIPFGAGRRICPGILFAVPNVELPLAQLLFHFDWKLPKQEDIDMTEEFGLSVRRKTELILIPTPYRASITVS
ncbi:hypothetical protein ES319_D13G157000v1 [Gossypium barbadense]|uniref:Cytochrome P450 n=2 Tax=Gossypium TaxID=3633 RepID=A0A5J5NQ50_GOSBA|nr:hypothetical protein ES319_D13G157000v1 [Gossypium barbadense]PPD83472.1 hypothetical protein GOBAR_DD19597 [Gossypium barbadense]TYG37768.1 hypothetical protein ES288_D13G167800v1 [Gossypium darwinii]